MSNVRERELAFQCDGEDEVDGIARNGCHRESPPADYYRERVKLARAAGWILDGRRARLCPACKWSPARRCLTGEELEALRDAEAKAREKARWQAYHRRLRVGVARLLARERSSLVELGVDPAVIAAFETAGINAISAARAA